MHATDVAEVMVGVEVAVQGLTKSFGSQRIWQDVSLTLPAGEVSALLGPSGTGKSVFLKSLIGLLRPEQGSIVIDGTDILQCSSKELYEIRKLFGVLFQDGALFGSMNLYDNIAFPLRMAKKAPDEIAEKTRLALAEVHLGATRLQPRGGGFWQQAAQVHAGQKQVGASRRPWVGRVRRGDISGGAGDLTELRRRVRSGDALAVGQAVRGGLVTWGDVLDVRRPGR